MKNLKTAKGNEVYKQSEDFIKDLLKCIRKEKTVQKVLASTWIYRDLLPKNSKKQFSTIKELKDYLIERRQKEDLKRLDEFNTRVDTVMAPQEDIVSIVISIEWKRSKMWGMNPSASAKVCFKNNTCQYFESGSVGGCGYDKKSTAVAKCLNQINGILKALYFKKDKNIGIKNHDLFGYGSGYGILPSFEGGVGVDCYPKIFDKIGYIFKTIAEGKSFDVIEITKK